MSSTLSPFFTPISGLITELIRVIYVPELTDIRLEGEKLDLNRNYFFPVSCKLQLNPATM